MILCLSAGAALAVTPEEVWTLWKSQTEQSGGRVTIGAETRNGAVLEISDAVTEQTSPEAQVSVRLDKILLKDLGDGTVEITLPDRYPLTVLQPKDKTLILEAELAQPGGKLIASGTAAAINFAFDYPEITATLTKVGDLDDVKMADVKASLALSKLSGKYLVTPQDDGKIGFNYAFDLGGVQLLADVNNPANEESFTTSASLQGLSAAARGNQLPPDGMTAFTAALRQGLAMQGQASSGAFEAQFALTQKDEKTTGSASFSAGDSSFGFDKEQIRYGFELSELQLAGSGAETGTTPMQASLGKLSFAVALPLVKDVVGDFSFVTRLVDLTLSEQVWGMFDPMRELARDPATLVLDLQGKAAWNIDLLAAKLGSMPDMPVRLETLALNQLLLRIIGGEIDAKGALAFDNDDLTSWDGIPAPSGKIDVQLKGINALLEKAVAMGLVPSDNLMALRMGMAMFTRPGPTPDTLSSAIEFKNNGLFVNGQQMK